MADSFWGLVLVAVVAGVILAMLGWAWQRHRRVGQLPVKAKASYEERRAKKSKDAHADLVRHVRRRAETLGVEIVDRVEGSSPAVVTHYPTGRLFAMFPDLPSYKAAAESGRTDPRKSHYGSVPTPVDRWSDDQLRNWLKQHQHDTPEN